ncbi:protein MIX23 isoform X1 [Danaus plexippus]|uniref:Protein MIX23 n=2 Tax=Danaus plexippus TaxID=13037 RepID=A0A212EJS6_DANPL|nr:protein MIX23 isoform X1 [Danaus plexippus]OWR41720.1 coiled-coil domain-containing protein 58 [Danaus plexippus plexippus]
MFCPDFLEFQDVLKKMRVLDDKIVYALNTSIPTESFKSKVDPAVACQDLFNQIQKGHSERENIIKNCIMSTAETVKKLKAVKESSPDDIDVVKNLKSEQRKLRLLQTELSVEEVINEKTSKIFNEQCRAYYKPGNL